jgi:hypothetical protein
MTESINQIAPPGPGIPPEILSRRYQAQHLYEIPRHPELPDSFQFREPVMFSRKMLESYARYAARHYPHIEKPEVKVAGVKLYRVVHQVPLPRDLVLRGKIDDETGYLPYYQGEYTPEGKLVNPQDPLLFWMIPILRVPREGADVTRIGSPDFKPNPNDLELRDFLKVHAETKTSR